MFPEVARRIWLTTCFEATWSARAENFPTRFRKSMQVSIKYVLSQILITGIRNARYLFQLLPLSFFFCLMFFEASVLHFASTRASTPLIMKKSKRTSIWMVESFLLVCLKLSLEFFSHQRLRSSCACSGTKRRLFVGSKIINGC